MTRLVSDDAGSCAGEELNSAYQLLAHPLEGVGGQRLQYLRRGQLLSWTDVISGWRAGAAFSQFFSDSLAALPCQALRWETPALSIGQLAEPFECVWLDCPALLTEASSEAFSAYLSGADHAVVQFDNLGGDARLVVPRAEGSGQAYGHLVAFCRRAPAPQQRFLWRTVALALSERLTASPRPVWLNTAGLGVPWLHVRLDQAPKYYQHRAYC